MTLKVQLQFRFFRDSQALGSGWSSSPELQIAAMWSEDSGSYWCEARIVTHNVIKMSQRSWIHVQKVPVFGVNLEIQPPGGQLTEGENLVLICSVAKGTGTITFSWHKDGIKIVGRKTQRSLVAELQVGAVTEHHTGRYYCAADNGHGPIHSKWSTVTVKIPASHPVLTLRMPRAQAMEGDTVELHCESLRGSPPISYLFYHKDVTLGSSSAPSRGGASFNLSLTAEHSGNYFCEADNGLGRQHSQRVSLNVTGKQDITGLITAGGVGGLLCILGVAATAALLCHCRTQRKSGGCLCPPALSCCDFCHCYNNLEFCGPSDKDQLFSSKY
uniref:Ig-like domain-containing protein n=1 Tax=Prolemur simus TaxID=1328070 RepID=A0A8C8YF38_PROSS